MSASELPPDERDAPRRRVTLDELRTHHDEIIAIGRRFGVSNIRVFGSVARGESDESSDIDLLVDVDEERGLLALSGFALEVEDLVRVFTQVATVQGLKQRLRDRVLAEAIVV